MTAGRLGVAARFFTTKRTKSTKRGGRISGLLARARGVCRGFLAPSARFISAPDQKGTSLFTGAVGGASSVGGFTGAVGFSVDEVMI
jgi:hypothetical protein